MLRRTLSSAVRQQPHCSTAAVSRALLASAAALKLSGTSSPAFAARCTFATASSGAPASRGLIKQQQEQLRGLLATPAAVRSAILYTSSGSWLQRAMSTKRPAPKAKPSAAPAAAATAAAPPTTKSAAATGAQATGLLSSVFSGKLFDLFRKYGWTFAGLYVVVYLSVLALAFVGTSASGAITRESFHKAVAPLRPYLPSTLTEMVDKIVDGASALQLELVFAWLCTEMMGPVRVAAVAALTPKVAGWLQKRKDARAAAVAMGLVAVTAWREEGEE